VVMRATISGIVPAFADSTMYAIADATQASIVQMIDDRSATIEQVVSLLSLDDAMHHTCWLLIEMTGVRSSIHRLVKAVGDMHVSRYWVGCRISDKRHIALVIISNHRPCTISKHICIPPSHQVL
jgi:hypothetical protein